MSLIKIKSIKLDAAVPKIQFVSIDGEQTTDSVFPGKDSKSAPPASSFESAVTCLLNAFQEQIEEVATERAWNIVNVAFLWSKEYDEWGYKVKLSGFESGLPLAEVVLTEKSNDAIHDKVYAALSKLQYEAERYVSGVSAQLNLLGALNGGESDLDLEEEEDAA